MVREGKKKRKACDCGEERKEYDGKKEKNKREVERRD